MTKGEEKFATFVAQGILFATALGVFTLVYAVWGKLMDDLVSYQKLWNPPAVNVDEYQLADTPTFVDYILKQHPAPAGKGD